MYLLGEVILWLERHVSVWSFEGLADIHPFNEAEIVSKEVDLKRFEGVVCELLYHA